MTHYQAMTLRRRVEILLGLGALATWIYAEFYLDFPARLLTGVLCVVAAFYFGWRVERTHTQQARIDSYLTAVFGYEMLKRGASDRLSSVFAMFRKKREPFDKLGSHKILLSDEISIELERLSKEEKNAASKTPSAA